MTNIRLKKTILIILEVIALFIATFIVVNPYKVVISEREKRKLTTFPEFSIESLISSEYFSNINDFMSDNFIFRDLILNINEILNADLLLSTYIKPKNDVAFISAKKENADASVNDNTDKNAAMHDGEYVGNGFILYNDRLYAKVNMTASDTKPFFDALGRYSMLFPNSKITFVPAPQSQLLIEDDKNLNIELKNQNDIISNMKYYAPKSINIVNSCKRLLDHRDEYIYFKFDHHWTNRGAYYAYKEMCESIKEDAPDLSEFKEVKLNDAWEGSAYSFTGDARLKGKTDELYAYISKKKNTMTISDNSGNIIEASNCIRPNYTSYSAFLGGDNPFTIITVPENDKEKCALVIKDSFGCAFVPYLVSNYGYIFVVDPRHADFNVYTMFKDYPIKDIIFMTGIYGAAESSYVRLVNELISR